eukprot:2570099-Rhodomonas_salina.1
MDDDATSQASTQPARNAEPTLETKVRGAISMMKELTKNLLDPLRDVTDNPDVEPVPGPSESMPRE